MDIHSNQFWGSVFGIVLFTFIGNFLLKKYKERGIPTYRFGAFVCYAVAVGYAVYLSIRFITG